MNRKFLSVRRLWDISPPHHYSVILILTDCVCICIFCQSICVGTLVFKERKGHSPRWSGSGRLCWLTPWVPGLRFICPLRRLFGPCAGGPQCFHLVFSVRDTADTISLQSNSKDNTGLHRVGMVLCVPAIFESRQLE
jgi:hypothetical protein